MRIIIGPSAVMDGLVPAFEQTFRDFADYLDTTVYVTSAFRAGDPGQHGKGLAIDFVVPSFDEDLYNLYLKTDAFAKFIGVGVYPDWHYNGQIVGGLHVDCRTGNPARWIGLGTGQGGGTDHGNIYLPFTDENLKKYGVRT